jgi:hypothetical protein
LNCRRVDREAVPVLFRRVADEIAEIQRGWTEFEAAIGSLRGRKFYGAMVHRTGEYWVCVERRPEDDPVRVGAEEGALPGGKYLFARLRGEPPAVYDLIGPTFRELETRGELDAERPSLEFYRARDVVDLFLPVA